MFCQEQLSAGFVLPVCSSSMSLIVRSILWSERFFLFVFFSFSLSLSLSLSLIALYISALTSLHILCFMVDIFLLIICIDCLDSVKRLSNEGEKKGWESEENISLIFKLVNLRRIKRSERRRRKEEGFFFSSSCFFLF